MDLQDWILSEISVHGSWKSPDIFQYDHFLPVECNFVFIQHKRR